MCRDTESERCRGIMIMIHLGCIEKEGEKYKTKINYEKSKYARTGNRETLILNAAH